MAKSDLPPVESIDPEALHAAENYALREIAALDELFALRGLEPCSSLERAILTTYIKAKRLGLIQTKD